MLFHREKILVLQTYQQHFTGLLLQWQQLGKKFWSNNYRDWFFCQLSRKWNRSHFLFTMPYQKTLWDTVLGMVTSTLSVVWGSLLVPSVPLVVPWQCHSHCPSLSVILKSRFKNPENFFQALHCLPDTIQSNREMTNSNKEGQELLRKRSRRSQPDWSILE